MPLRGFSRGFKFFNSVSNICETRCFRFSLSFTTEALSCLRSIRRFKDYSYQSSLEGHSVLPSLQANYPIRLDFALVIQSKLLSSISYTALKFRKRISFKTHTVSGLAKVAIFTTNVDAENQTLITPAVAGSAEH
jgi:hypothetical protein